MTQQTQQTPQGPQGPIFQKYVPARKIRTVGTYYVVYEATEAGFERPVELRILNHKVKPDSPEYKRFSHEFKTLAQLDHPNVIRVLDLGVVQNHVFYVTDRRESRSLAEMIADPERTFSIRDALIIFKSIASALAHLHRREILHRDISENTIYLEVETRIPYIAEFSLVKNFSMEDLSGIGIPQMVSLLDTPEFRTGKPQDQRTDIFLLGRLVFKLLTYRQRARAAESGQRPAIAAEDIEKSKMHPRITNEEVPPEFDEVVAKCLAQDPAERYQTVEELQDRLEEAEQKLSVKFALSRLAETTQNTLMRGGLERQQKKIEQVRERNTKRLQEIHEEKQQSAAAAAAARKTLRYDMAEAGEGLREWGKRNQGLIASLAVALLLLGCVGFAVWERSTLMDEQNAARVKKGGKPKIYDPAATYDDKVISLAATVKNEPSNDTNFSDRWYLLKDWVGQLMRAKAKPPFTMQELTDVRKLTYSDSNQAYRTLDEMFEKAEEFQAGGARK